MKDLEIHPDFSRVVLKDNDKKVIPFEPTEKTIADQAFLSTYDRWISTLDINLNGSSHVFHPSCMHRVFNNSSFTSGGRIYGGWWQGLNSDERKRISINGHLAVEIDFSAMQIGLLYASKRIDYFGTYGSDLYTLEGYEGEDDYRSFCKHCLVCMVGSVSKDKAIRGILGKLRGEPEKYSDLTDKEAKDIVSELETIHADIADCFYQGLGMSTQYQDSEIAMSILRYFTRKGVPVLSVHDSFIIERAYREELEQVMLDAFSEATKGCTGRVA